MPILEYGHEYLNLDIETVPSKGYVAHSKKRTRFVQNNRIFKAFGWTFHENKKNICLMMMYWQETSVSG